MKTIVAPGSVKGFMSSVIPMALPKGYVAGLYDVRLGTGAVSVRPGSLLVNSAVNGTQTYRGCFECDFGGVHTIFVGTSDGTDVSILKSVDAGLTFTEVSDASTRLSDVGPVFFGLVEKGSAPLLIVQNGTDDPRVYDGTNFEVADPTTPSVTASLSAGFLSAETWAGVTNADITNSNPGNLAASIVTYPGGDALSVFVDYSVVASTNTATIDVSGSASQLVNPAVPTQFAFLIDSFNQDSTPPNGTDPTEGWRNLKIEASTTGTAGPWHTIYDPASSVIVTEDLQGTAKMVGVANFGSLPAGTVQAYRLSWVGPRPLSGKDYTIPIYALAATGYVTGGTNYGLAYGSSTAYTGGPGTILTAPTQGPAYAGVQVPISSLFNYVYRVDYTTPASLGSFDRLDFFRSDVGSSNYYFSGSETVTPSLTDFYKEGDSSPIPSVDYTHLLPAADAIPLPIGTSMATINDRLFVCSGNRMYYSEAGNPLSFSVLVRYSNGSPVPTSAGSFSKPGETFMAVIGVGSVLTGSETLGTPQSGAVSVYTLTDRTTYVLSGFDAASLNKTTPICVGTKSPFSLSRGSSGGFTFFDSDRQVRRVVGVDSVALSRYVVDSLLNVPDSRLKWVDGATFDERYYMAHTPLGATANTRILVYQDGGGFESLDRPRANAQGLLNYSDRCLAFSETALYEHGVGPTEYDGARVQALLVGPEIEKGTLTINAKESNIVADVDSGGTLTYSILCTTGTRSGAVPSPAVSMAARKTGETRIAVRTGTGVGADSLSIQPSLAISALGGTRLYYLFVDASEGSDAVTA